MFQEKYLERALFVSNLKETVVDLKTDDLIALIKVAGGFTGICFNFDFVGRYCYAYF